MRMRPFCFISLLLVDLSGCVTATSPYGNFVFNTAQANDNKVVDDVIKQLVILYSPAVTRFNLQHATPDYFGTYLVDSLRSKGYAISEFKPETQTANNTPPITKSETPTTPGLSLSYIVDQPKESDLYRITLIINHQQSLARVYQVAQDGVIHPAGYWVRKE